MKIKSAKFKGSANLNGNKVSNICDKNIRENFKAVCCDLYDKWVHIKCNSISPNRHDELCDEKNDESFHCIVMKLS